MLLTEEEKQKLETLSPEHRKLIEVARDFYRYCLNNLKIRTKNGDVVGLELNNIQKQIVELVLDDLMNQRPVRYIILKARQEGVSTIVEALIYWWTATHKNVKSKIIAHDGDTAKQLYEMFRRYYDNSNPLFKPATKYNTRTDLTFDNDLGTGIKSQIDVASAQNTGTGRGQTIQWLHGSEVAMWPNGAELVAGLMQAVPKLPNTAIFLESTANGIGDFFHKTWQASKAGNSVFKPLFFSWKEHEEYQLNPPKNFKLTPDEKKLKRDYDLTDAQVYWRRETMKEFVADPQKFYQEYPLTDSEAFLSSGRSRFDIPSLIKMEEKCFNPTSYELYEDEEIVAKPLIGAPLKIWKMPQPEKSYVIGADVAEGVNKDYSVATIMDEDNMETVARWRGDAEPSEFGEILDQLGRFYNNALIAAEINNHGLTTVQRLRDLNYSNLYRREKGLEERFEQHTSKLGWKTDRKTKPLMIDALSEAITAGKIKDYDITFVRECMSYVIDERGRTNAQQGEHDDTVISTAICLQVFDWNDAVVGNKYVKSAIPEQYLTIKSRMQKLKKTLSF
jgi:hypothetical protein